MLQDGITLGRSSGISRNHAVAVGVVAATVGRFSSRQVLQHQQQLDHAPRITNQTAQARDDRDQPAFITCFVDTAGCAVSAAALFSSTFSASSVSIAQVC